MKFLVQNQPCYAYTGGKPFDATKPALLFIHGAANDHSVWHLQARYFAHHGWNVLAVDLPGHGRSDGKPLASISEYSQWVIAFLDNADIATNPLDADLSSPRDRLRRPDEAPRASHSRNVALVGHSMGSLIALDTALKLPDRISQLVLMGAAVPMPVTESLLNAARDDTPAANEMINTWGHGPRARLGASAVPGVSLTASNLRLLEQADAGVLHNDLSACNAYARSAEELGAMKVPTLILVGERDQMTPPKANAALVKQLPGARSVVLPDVGHGMMYEDPDGATEAMVAFLKPVSD